MLAMPRYKVVGNMERFDERDNIQSRNNFIETVAKVCGQGAASCYSCGYGETCKVGIPYFLHGEGFKITPDVVPDVSKQRQVMEAAGEAGILLGKRLREGHDRQAVTQKMQRVMMDKFSVTV
jgi:hypothetical protein